jgi:tRNA pseudouridine55 synthase
MRNVFAVYKPISKTPLEMIHQIKEKYPELKNEKMGYAGRLDPLAEGVLIILVGEECKNRKSYEQMPKVYEFEVLFGISTDSYDVMGLIQSISSVKVNDEKVQDVAFSFIGEFEQPYPPYSSVKFKGRSLFHWARENKLSEVIIPSKKVNVSEISYIGKNEINGSELLKEVTQRIENVKGIFRQQTIIDEWNTKMQKYSNVLFPIYKFKIVCSSGTYVRSIANGMGKLLQVPSLAYSIKRTEVGEYNLSNCHFFI